MFLFEKEEGRQASEKQNFHESVPEEVSQVLSGLQKLIGDVEKTIALANRSQSNPRFFNADSLAHKQEAVVKLQNLATLSEEVLKATNPRSHHYQHA